MEDSPFIVQPLLVVVVVVVVVNTGMAVYDEL